MQQIIHKSKLIFANSYFICFILSEDRESGNEQNKKIQEKIEKKKVQTFKGLS